MKFFIVSYVAGMFGEFFCSLVGKNLSFYKPKDYSDVNEYKIKNNRWIYPDYLSLVGFHAKTFSSEMNWKFTYEQKRILFDMYKDKSILVPTHWYQQDLTNIDLPCTGIRLYCYDKNIFLLSYILFWIKSHVSANYPWPSRIEEINNLISNNHKYSNKLQDLLIEGQYHNWKYLSYKNNWLINDEENLGFYIMCLYKRNQIMNNNLSSKWYNLDIGELFYGNSDSITQFEKDFDINLDRQLIKIYSQENIDLVERELHVSFKDLSLNWYMPLFKYIKQKI